MRLHAAPDSGQGGGPRRYETRDARFGPVMGTAFSLIGVMVVGLAFSWGVYEIFTSLGSRPERPAETFTVPDTLLLPPGPNLEADPARALAVLRHREDEILNGYGWTDSARGIARVPIARAMELYLEEAGKR